MLKIITAPDVHLSTVAEPVSYVDDGVREIVFCLFEAMSAADGVGLAATQVGIMKRIFVIHLPKTMDESEPKYAFINPEITYFSENLWEANEGCLSFPDIRIAINRPAYINVKYLDEYGAPCELQARDWLARAIQHELDHLNGVTIVRYVSSIKRDSILKKLTKHKKKQE